MYDRRLRVALALVFVVGCDRSDGTPTDGPTDGSPATGLVNTSTNADDGIDTVMPSGPGGLTAGNLAVVFVHWGGVGTAIANVTDTAGNIYLPVSQTDHPTTGGSAQMWYANQVLGAADNEVVATFTGNASLRRILVHEYTGVASGAPRTAGAFGTSILGETPSVDISANDLVVGDCYVTTGAVTAFTEGNLFELRATASQDSQTEDRVANTAALGNATITMSPAASWIMLLAVFSRD